MSAPPDPQTTLRQENAALRAENDRLRTENAAAADAVRLAAHAVEVSATARQAQQTLLDDTLALARDRTALTDRTAGLARAAARNADLLDATTTALHGLLTAYDVLTEATRGNGPAHPDVARAHARNAPRLAMVRDVLAQATGPAGT